MINKNEVIDFFNSCAPAWDEEMIRSDDIIKIILDNAGIKEGIRVLDVACGTGVLIPDYLKRNVSSVTGIDISAGMLERARAKFGDRENVHFICGDVENTPTGEDFDAVVVYNAFPHFPEPEKLISKLSGLLRRGGILTVAHGMSRERIDSHHHGRASRVSVGLMSAGELAEIFRSAGLEVTAVISDSDMYQVAGKRA